MEGRKSRLSLSFHISKTESLVFLALLFVVGLYLRLGPVIHRDLWEDELFSIDFASRPYSVISQLLYPLDDRPPLFYLFVRFLLGVSRETVVLRLPSLLASLSCILLAFKIFAEKSRVLALIVAAVFTFSPFAVEYGWQLRDYGVLLFISLLSMYLFSQLANRWWADPDARPYPLLFGLVLTNLVGCGLNYIYLCFVFSLLVMGSLMMIVLGSRKLLRPLLLLWISHLAILVLWLPYLFRQKQLIQKTTTWIPQVSIQGIEGFVAALAGFRFTLDEINQMVGVWPWQEALAAIALIVVGLTLIFLKRRTVSKELQWYVWVGIGTVVLNLLLIIAISWGLGRSLFLPRTFLPAAVVFSCSWGIILYEELKLLRRLSLGGILLTALIVALWSGSYWMSYFDRYPSLMFESRFERFQTFRPVVYAIRQNLSSDLHVVLLPVHFQSIFLSAYFAEDKLSLSRLAAELDQLERDRQLDAPISLKRKGQKIILVRLKNYIDPSLNYYSSSYLESNNRIEAKVRELCGGEMEYLGETPEFVVERCELE